MRAKRHHGRINSMKSMTDRQPGAPARAPRRTVIRFAILVLAVLVLGHDLTFLASSGLDGLGVALARSGHGAYWPFTWLVAAAAVATLGLLGVLRATRLLRTLRGDRAGGPAGRTLPGLRAYAAELLRLWPRIALLALLVFVAQEASEHYLMHGGHVLSVTDFISGTYAATLPAFVAASLLVASIAALFVRTIAALEDAVRIASASMPRPARRAFVPMLPVFARLRTSLATPDIGRVPPLLALH